MASSRFSLPLFLGDVTVVAIVTNHLFSLVWEMRTHGREPFKSIKDLFLFSIFGIIGFILRYLSTLFYTPPLGRHGIKRSLVIMRQGYSWQIIKLMTWCVT